MRKFWISILFILCSQIAYAATYTIGPGQTYETFTALEAAVVLAGDDIVDGGGNTFHETWIPQTNGSAGHQITLQNAIIDSRQFVSSWTDDGGGKYHASTTADASFLVEDDIVLLKSTDATLSDGNWFYASNVIYYKPTSGVPGDHTVGYSIAYGVLVSNRHHISILNIDFKYAGHTGVRSVSTTTNNESIIVDGCTFDYCLRSVYLQTIASATNSDITIENSVFTRSGCGIILATTPTGADTSTAINSAFTIEDNSFYYIGYANGTTSWDTVIRATTDKECIGTQNLQNSTIQRNYAYGGYKARGILLYVRQDGTVTGNTVTMNGMFNLGGYGLFAGGNLLGADISNNSLFGNIVYECGDAETTSKYGAYLGDITTPTGTYNYFYNNVIMGGTDSVFLKDYWKVKNNTLADYSRYAYLASQAHSHSEADYNCIYPATGNIAYDSEARTLEAWQGLGYDTHSVTGDPKFYNPALHDFRVHSDGAGVEKGTDLGATYQRDYYGHWQGDNGALWDIGTIWFDHKPTIQ